MKARNETLYGHSILSTGRAKKVNPWEKFYISGIVAAIFTEFARFTDEDSIHISCKFY